MFSRYGNGATRGPRGLSANGLTTLRRMAHDARTGELVPRWHQQGMTKTELRIAVAADHFTRNTGLSILDYPGGVDRFMKDLESGRPIKWRS